MPKYGYIVLFAVKIGDLVTPESLQILHYLQCHLLGVWHSYFPPFLTVTLQTPTIYLDFVKPLLTNSSICILYVSITIFGRKSLTTGRTETGMLFEYTDPGDALSQTKVYIQLCS